MYILFEIHHHTTWIKNNFIWFYDFSWRVYNFLNINYAINYNYKFINEKCIFIEMV